MGEAEIRRIRRLIESGKIFRYGSGGECDRFEAAWASHLGVKYARMTRSGTSALYTALVGLGVGPGDQVVVPAYTYMATALAVLSAGAIPVIADVDDSLTLSAAGLERRLTRHTRAVIPVHMVGLPCDMDGIMKVARRHDLLVLEDACQALGAIGHAGAFSFNFFKNITCGEGGAFVTRSKAVWDRGSVAVDCCSFYWQADPEAPGGPRSPEDLQFAGHNFRASEFEGAILNVQLGRLDRMLARMRDQKKALVEAGEAAGLTWWEPILRQQGAHHPALDPFKIPANRKCRVSYSRDMCARSLDILGRAVLVPCHPDHRKPRIEAMIRELEAAATAGS